jgi:hypothetical protein
MDGVHNLGRRRERKLAMIAIISTNATVKVKISDYRM